LSIYFLLYWLPILFFIVRFFYKIERFEFTESNSNHYKDLVQNIELETNSIESDNSIEKLVDFPIKIKNSFLNPNDDFGTLKKGVVVENQIYEYEVVENDNSNFTIIELDDNSKKISE
jgi:hypothetical protein